MNTYKIYIEYRLNVAGVDGEKMIFSITKYIDALSSITAINEALSEFDKEHVVVCSLRCEVTR